MIDSYLQTSLQANRYSIRLSQTPAPRTDPAGPAQSLQGKVRRLFEAPACAIDLRRLLRTDK